MMETIRFDVEENSRVVIQAIGGDLRVTGRTEMVFEAQSPERGRMVARQDGALIELDSRSNCLVFVPESVQLEVSSVGGDARVTGVQGGVSIGTVGGDLSLQRLTTASVQKVGGDVDVRRNLEQLDIDWAGGDMVIDRASGQVRVKGVGGDLRLRRCSASVDASAGGDIRLDLEPPAGSSSTLMAGGDTSCSLPETASARVSLAAGGDLIVHREDDIEYEDGETEIMVGDGAAELKLRTGGDIRLQIGARTQEVNDVWEESLEEAGRDIADVEAALGALGLHLSIGQTEKINRAVRRAVSRAGHKHTVRSRRADKAHRDKPHRVNINFGFAGAGASQPTDEEKLSILKMLEAGTITIEEADMLLQALEGTQ